MRDVPQGGSQFQQVSGAGRGKLSERMKPLSLAQEPSRDDQIEPPALLGLAKDDLPGGKTDAPGRAVQQHPDGRRALQQLGHGMRADGLYSPGPGLTLHASISFCIRPAVAAGRGGTPFAGRLREKAFGDASLRGTEFHGRITAPQEQGWLRFDVSQVPNAGAGAPIICVTRPGYYSGGTQRTGTRERASRAKAVPCGPGVPLVRLTPATRMHG